MRFSTLTRWTPFIFLLCVFVACSKPDPLPKQPTLGTIVKSDMEENGSKDKREAWFESMHRAAPDVNWRKVELENAMTRQSERGARESNRDDYVEIAYGKVAGTWHERGSDNQAGSVKASTYDVETGYIYTVADGGSLFRGTPFNDRWEVVNQEFVFDGAMLEIFEFNQQKRMLASSGGVPMYSDDMGETWEISKGVAAEDAYATSYNLVCIGKVDPYMYMLTKSSYWNAISVYRSTNGGESFHPIRPLGNSDTDKFWLSNPPGTEDLYLFDRIDNTRTDIYRYAVQVNVFWPIESTTSLTFEETPTMVISRLIDSTTHFFAYATGDTVKVSSDTGKTWVSRGVIPEHPWTRRFFVFESDPEHLLAGGVELYASHDGGFSWEKLNHWWEYYDDVPNKIHADMMYFREFYDPQKEEYFTLISNHGGMSITRDYGQTTQNIGMAGLNVSQYYSVRTDPLDASIVYAGSQDQGFQRGFLLDESHPDNFDQLISGDYGHIVFSENGQRLWAVYPNGSVSYYHNPHTDPGPQTWYELESENETVWIPPLVQSPFGELNEIYMAGGNAEGGPGSHLIKLTWDNFSIEAEQFPYDFLAERQGEVSAIAFSPHDPEIIYVGTTGGGFFTSMDGGQTWETQDFIGPGAQYLYGNHIYASRLTPGMLLYAGSGYSNSPVWLSIDHGQSFVPMNEGLPPTLVFEVAANADETAYFAATESGPYIYIVEDQSWYPMSGGIAPSTRYWSVEYLENQDRVRFGTYGRGIWDFQVTVVTSTSQVSGPDADFIVYPNPATHAVRISIPDIEPTRKCSVSIFTIRGELVLSLNGHQVAHDIDLSGIQPGMYLLQLDRDGQQSTRKFLKL